MNPGPTRARWSKTAVIVGLAIGLVLAFPAPAVAHDGLVASTPAADSIVTAPLESVSLTFSDELLDIGDANGAFAIQVVGPDDLFYNLGCVQRDGATASTAVALGESGSYEVTWQVVSSDAHITSDSSEFTYEKPVDGTSATGAATAPCRQDDSPAAQGGEAAEHASQSDEEARAVLGIWVGGAGLVGFLILCAIAVAVLGARSRRRDQLADQTPSSDQQASNERQPE